MTNFTFNWPKGPDSVTVTGTFDDWSQQYALIKKSDGSFSLEIPFPKDTDKILFKFIINGNDWVISDNYQTELDVEGHVNNVLDLKKVAQTQGKQTIIPESGLAMGTGAVAGAASASAIDATVMPSQEGKQVTLGEPGIVIPENPQEIDAFKEVRDIDAKKLNEGAGAAKSSGLDTTVMPSQEGKQVTLGEPGVVIPENPREIDAFKEVRDIDAKKFNEDIKKEEAQKAKAEEEEKKKKYVKKVVKKVKKEDLGKSDAKLKEHSDKKTDKKTEEKSEEKKEEEKTASTPVDFRNSKKPTTSKAVPVIKGGKKKGFFSKLKSSLKA